MTSYPVDLDLTRGAVVFGSTSTVRFRCGEPDASTFIEVQTVRRFEELANL